MFPITAWVSACLRASGGPFVDVCICTRPRPRLIYRSAPSAVCFSLSLYLVKYIEEEDTRYRNFSLRQLGRYSSTGAGATTATVAAASGTLGTAALL